MRQANALAWLGFVGLLAVPAPVDAQSVKSLGNERVAVHARAVPLGQLLAELSALAPMDVTLTDPALAQRPVDVVLDEVPIAQAAAWALRETGLSFAIGGLVGEPLRVFVGDSHREVMAAQLAASGSADGGHQPTGPGTLIDQVRGQINAGATMSEVRNMMKERGEHAAAASSSDVDPDPAPEPAPVEEIPIHVPANGQAPGYTMVGESVTFDDPNFVPYKNTEAARNARLAVDISTIP